MHVPVHPPPPPPLKRFFQCVPNAAEQATPGSRIRVRLQSSGIGEPQRIVEYIRVAVEGLGIGDITAERIGRDPSTHRARIVAHGEVVVS